MPLWLHYPRAIDPQHPALHACLISSCALFTFCGAPKYRCAPNSEHPQLRKYLKSDAWPTTYYTRKNVDPAIDCAKEISYNSDSFRRSGFTVRLTWHKNTFFPLRLHSQSKFDPQATLITTCPEQQWHRTTAHSPSTPSMGYPREPQHTKHKGYVVLDFFSFSCSSSSPSHVEVLRFCRLGNEWKD